MINIKTDKEIESMVKGGKILVDVLSAVLRYAKQGVSELELDAMAEKLIREKGAEPGFKKIKGYNHTICISTNDVVVHGVPTSYKLKEGDIVGIDCGVFYKGFHTDAAHTIQVKNSEGVNKFLKTGEQALWEAIKQAKPGNRIGHISKTIQDIIEGAGYSVVRSLIGHGVGRQLHEEPEVPGFLNRKIEKTPLLVEGMTIAVEVIYNMGKKEVKYGNKDGWTISTADGSISGLFERTIALIKDGNILITK
ncbi:MAG: type I methionyl aminopeptidase [Candidatus Levyibacteriota bacterium]|nr:MAG: type I methionyl aminopeptidase [Candidatus Levybacteria bacterium]